jgi:hypothetical protein
VDCSITLSLTVVFTAPINSAGSALIYSALCFLRAFAFSFCFCFATSFAVHALRSCMVRIKFTTHPCTPAVSPKFGSMASDEAFKASVEHREISTEQLEISQGGQQATVSTETALEHGAGSDQENQSRGSGDDKTVSETGGHVRIGAEDALVGISYDFGKSGITKACIASLENLAHYFPKGYGREPGVESVPNP